MMQRFENKVAVITGGGSGIGQSAAIKFASEGAHVVILDLDMSGADKTKKLIESAGGNASIFECNVANQQQVNDVVDAILKDRKIDILVNNAGIAHIGNLETTEESDLDRIYQVNVKGCYNMMKAVIGSMKANKSGVILNLASVASSVGIADRFAYSMSKGAVLTMTYSVAKDFIADGIRCNCIAPGRVHTPFVDNFLEKNYSQLQIQKLRLIESFLIS